MNIIQEQFIQINLWCRPLARSRYSYSSDIRKAPLRTRSDGTKTLLAAMREKERREDEASKILRREQREADAVHKEYTNALSLGSETYAGFNKEELAEQIESEMAAQDTEAEERKGRQRLRRIRSKVATALFDYSEIEQEKIEEQINSLVNADGYYDEVEPADAEVDYGNNREVNKTLVFLIGLLIAFLAVSALYFHFIV